MRRLPGKQLIASAGVLVCVIVAGQTRLSAQPQILTDPAMDTQIRRTDFNNDGAIDPAMHALPDLIEIRAGSFSPFEPEDNRFAGQWNNGGGFIRVDLVFAGLVNPPGKLGLSSSNPQYDPFRYGPNPVFGFIEFDVDQNEDTGGELAAPQFRYTGNVGRFGGMPSAAYLWNRIAIDATAFDANVQSAPFIDRSGEEFHWVFLGEEIGHVHVDTESPGGNPSLFEAGETWTLDGEFIHRAHGFEEFAVMCFESEGVYEDEAKIQFRHSLSTNQTTVSLVYPKTNAGFLELEDPNGNLQPNDGCADGQSSVEEALEDLWFSATIADAGTRSLPEFQLIAGWEFEDPSQYLDASTWRITALVGTTYAGQQPDGAVFAWTDVYPNPVIGDFDGDGSYSALDDALRADYVLEKDGTPSIDQDGPGNGTIELVDFAPQFCLFDVNYDGRVNSLDSFIPGDMDINQVVNFDDVDDFVQGLLDPVGYAADHGGQSAQFRGDIDGDGALDGGDISQFLLLIL